MMDLALWTDPLADSNCYLLGEGGACVVIDPNDPKGPAGRLEELGWTPELVFLTHEHCDHMAGVPALRARWPEVKVVASAACSANLQNTRINMSAMMEVYLTFHGKPGVTYPPFACGAADITYTKPYETVWRGHRIRCVPLPGHTPGSAGVFWDGDTLFSGDYLLPCGETVLRLPGGSEEDYETFTRPFLEALPRGLTVRPGHGISYTLGRREDAAGWSGKRC